MYTRIYEKTYEIREGLGATHSGPTVTFDLGGLSEVTIETLPGHSALLSLSSLQECRFLNGPTECRYCPTRIGSYCTARTPAISAIARAFVSDVTPGFNK